MKVVIGSMWSISERRLGRRFRHGEVREAEDTGVVDRLTIPKLFWMDAAGVIAVP